MINYRWKIYFNHFRHMKTGSRARCEPHPNYQIDNRLQKKLMNYGFFKPGDELITLKGAGHPFMDRNPVYLDSLKRILH